MCRESVELAKLKPIAIMKNIVRNEGILAGRGEILRGDWRDFLNIWGLNEDILQK